MEKSDGFHHPWTLLNVPETVFNCLHETWMLNVDDGWACLAWGNLYVVTKLMHALFSFVQWALATWVILIEQIIAQKISTKAFLLLDL